MITINTAEAEESIDIMTKAANADLIEDVNQLAISLREEGDNEGIRRVYEACKQFQKVFNDSFKPAVDKLIANFRSEFDWATKDSNRNMSDFKPVDAGFKVDEMNPDTVKM